MGLRKYVEVRKEHVIVLTASPRKMIMSCKGYVTPLFLTPNFFGNPLNQLNNAVKTDSTTVCSWPL